ncbi:hypothetical protein [Massilia sp. YIM B04103]|uniref:hypothetical protein n=1 Tax=Massilia sp. YIM B04103 TaxID=2963106 RepID=UPI00210BAB84|nr:hypothetical protein [Massilia sp. YIM B04103]
MNTSATRPLDLDAETFRQSLQTAIELLGTKWFKRRLAKDDEDRELASKRNHNKLRVRHQASHPLVQWHREYEVLPAEGEGELPLNQSLLLLASFANNLVKARNAPGIEHVIRRLKEAEAFLAAAFEVEVAVFYLNGGNEVEFLETGDSRSPDLLVRDAQGWQFWAECKYKEEMSERDQTVQACWEMLKDGLYKVWGPAKSNLSLRVHAANDPVKSEIEELKEGILRLGRQMLEHAERDKLTIQAGTRSGKYDVALRYLGDPDAERQAALMDAGDEYYEWRADIQPQDGGAVLMRNPKEFGFSNANPPDKYRGALNSFNSAVGQIPPSGPGVIWIRVPFPTGYQRAQQDLEALAAKLQQELSGKHNRRINAVILKASWFSDEENAGAPALTYRHELRAIEHVDPANKLP